ncbi:MAG TPA: potassium transporter TrkH, partial [Rhodospirillales bacterium]|nr:potassium transporter TrkH [Rhodospirillales bacterium]
MNRIVFIAIGLMLVMLGALMDVPAILDASLGNPDWKVFAISSGVSFFIGGALVLA